MGDFPGMGGGGDFMFSVFPTIFTIVFICIVGFILFSIISGIRQWSHNNSQPVLTVDAKIKSKRTSVSSHMHNHNDNMAHHSTSTTYYVTFEVQSGDRMEFHVTGREYGMLAEGDYGKLTFQGTRYHKFDRIIE